MKATYRKPLKTSTFLYLLLLCMIILPITVISSAILQFYKQDLLEQSTNKTLQLLRAVTYSEEQEIRRVVNFSSTVSMDREVLENATLLRSYKSIGKHNYKFGLQRALDQYASSMSGHVLSINFFYKSGTVYSYLKDLKKQVNEVQRNDWYEHTLQEQDQVKFVGIQSDLLYNVSDNNNIVTTISPSSLQGIHDIELITFVFSRDAFEQVLSQHPSSQTSSFYIVDLEGTIIASSGNNNPSISPEIHNMLFETPEGTFNESVDGIDMVFTYSTVDTADWRVVHQVTYEELMSNYNEVFTYVTVATLIVLVLSLLISFYLVHYMAKPIQVLVLKMSRVMQGNLNAKIAEKGTREMVTAAQTFNHMMDEIKRLMNEREEEEKAKRKAEFAALQSQINPHFLINTLNSIKLMALITKTDNIRTMTHALIRLLSSSFNRGSSLTAISEEIENLRHYVYIMETRYGSKFEVVWEIEEGSEPLYILKLLLQPILENSIVHGLSSKVTDGMIVIGTKKTTQGLIISIKDNGVGMSEEQISVLHEDGHSDAFSGMGVRNVNQRIRLHYGVEYGVSIERNETGGTTFYIRVPLIYDANDEET